MEKNVDNKIAFLSLWVEKTNKGKRKKKHYFLSFYFAIKMGGGGKHLPSRKK